MEKREKKTEPRLADLLKNSRGVAKWRSTADQKQEQYKGISSKGAMQAALLFNPLNNYSSFQRVTVNYLNQKHRNGKPITLVTAYDYPSAVHLDEAGIDVCLVGDSAAMVVHGHETAIPVTLDEMLVHCRAVAVAREAKRPLLVGDLPFGGGPSRISAAKAIVEAGIAVMGHVGLTPQAVSVLGGFRPQGRNVTSAMIKVVETALALQDAGCFSVVLECVPAPVAAAATAALQIPTIGIGAGPFCSGQREMHQSGQSIDRATILSIYEDMNRLKE
ncbi:hypothetical protein H6P81_015180 [Aristolochia fimbriata]|uniref:3-methyl-2-oxobutanoate hydroxymethyltransferase n=1 Tax=Aristolochia fimbriata TaxID=158543 RepID=A0AAV7E4J9_ARIFI|nr:hypothetical protein H6P81_015180 [Aristolochia fimbriata]